MQNTGADILIWGAGGLRHELGLPLPPTEPADPDAKPSKDELAALQVVHLSLCFHCIKLTLP